MVAGRARCTAPRGRRPTRCAALAPGGDAGVLRDTAVVLAGVRKAKSEAKVSMRTDVAAATVSGPQEALDRVAAGRDDLQATGRVGELVVRARRRRPSPPPSRSDRSDGRTEPQDDPCWCRRTA